MLNADAIQKVIELAKYEVKEIGGVQFHVGAEEAKPLQYPKVQTVHVFGLSQFLNYIEAACEKFKSVYINVLNETRVQLIDAQTGQNLEVVVHVEADFSKTYSPFLAGRQYSQEDFIVELMSKFEMDEARSKLISLVSRVMSGKTVESEDDGVSQEVTVKSGVTLVKQETLQNLWTLRPFRTFPEVQQPQLPFLLRVSGDNSPRFTLHEVDGGAWKVEVTKTIRDYCAEFVLNRKLSGKVKVL